MSEATNTWGTGYGCACTSRDSIACAAARYGFDFMYEHCDCLCHQWDDDDDFPPATQAPGALNTMSEVAALFVETGGCYFGLPGVDPWDEARDARKYAGPHPVVAHPPCQRWGRYWHGSTAKPHQFEKGADGGCFEHAFWTVTKCGGVIEHPADSHAWAEFGIPKPPRSGGWIGATIGYGMPPAWTCCVYQGHYGHLAGKPSWLFVSGLAFHDLPELRWGKTEQRIHPRALELHGYEKARRIGMMAMVGGKDKTRIRNATPPEFRDVLLDIARSAHRPIELAA